MLGVVSTIAIWIFAIISMGINHVCGVYDWRDRCCECPTLNASRLIGQSMPEHSTQNSFLFGGLVILNSGIGLVFVIESVRKENKYQLIFALVSKAVGITREIVDLFLEHYVPSNDVRYARIGLVSIDVICCICMALLTPRLFKQFGWRLFRKSGGNAAQRDIYLVYQQTRGLNWLESQASVIIHVFIILWLRFARDQFWTWFMATLVELVSSRQAIHHLKRENAVGIYLAIVGKTFCFVYCIIVSYLYAKCKQLFDTSLKKSGMFFTSDDGPYPDLVSVRESYSGIHCLPDHTRHDDSTLELIIVSLVLMGIFRVAFVGSILHCMRCLAGEHSGLLKALFYKANRQGKKKKRNKLTINGEVVGEGDAADGGRSDDDDDEDEDQRAERWLRDGGESDADDKQSLATHGNGGAGDSNRRLGSGSDDDEVSQKNKSSNSNNKSSKPPRTAAVAAAVAGNTAAKAATPAAAAGAAASDKPMTAAEKRRLGIGGGAKATDYTTPAGKGDSGKSKGYSFKSAGSRGVAASGVYGAGKPEGGPGEEDAVQDFTNDGGDW
jgi:hypothetical protein